MPNPVKQSLIIWSDFSPFARFSIQSGYVSEVQMQQALAETRKTRKPLTDALELITGHPVPANLLRQYKKQQLFKLKVLYGLESIDLEIVEVSNDQISELIDMLISIDICRRYCLLPLSKRETQPPIILVAMVDPDNLDAIDDLERILRPQRIDLRRTVIIYEDYQQLLSRYLNEHLARQKQMEMEKPVGLEEDLENLDTFFGSLDEVETNLDAVLNNSFGASIINLVNKIMAQAVQEGASDIHVEPQAEYLRVRFRKDGVLRQAFEPSPKKITPAVSNRFKVMAELNISERRVPQEGRIRRMFQGRKVDFLVSTLPSRYGEKVVLQILYNESTQLGLDKLITDPNTLQMVREMA
ncbi:MAG TPA: ATPase, T2SS/T4P/T4SS family, partial [Cyanophyceae cyanobacterium]